MQGLTAFQRHKRLLREYEAFYGSKPASAEQQNAIKSDVDTLKEQYRQESIENAPLLMTS